MPRTLLYFALILLTSASEFHKSNLSCKLAASTFDGLTCEQEEPYLVFGGTLTYLVKKNDKLMQLKVKRLTGNEFNSYKKKLEESLKPFNNKDSESKKEAHKDIKKEIVSSETEELLKNMQNEQKNETSKKIEIDIDNNIDASKKSELRHLKIKNILVPEAKKEQRLEEKVNKEPEEQLSTEKTEIINPFTLVKIPKKEVVKLNEAQILLKFKEKRGFQNLIDENVFAGHKLFLLDHPEHGTLEEFISAQQSLSEEEKYFDSELKKMKFFDILTQTVVDLHEMGYVHTNLSITTVFVDSNFDPIIGGFDFVQEIDSMEQIDPDFFVTTGKIVLAKNLNDLDPKTFGLMKENEKGPALVDKDIKIKESEPISINAEGKDTQNKNSEIKVEIKMEFKRSLEFVAPELLLAGTERAVYFDSKIDTYSLGSIYFYMLYYHSPFNGNSKEELLESLKGRLVTLKAGTSTNSVSLLMNSLNLDPNTRAPTYYLGLRLKRVLSMDFRHVLNENVELSTDFDYTNRYGRDFFDKYSEMIFVLMMAFIIIPATVFLASYKFKNDARRQIEQERQQEEEREQNERQRNQLPEVIQAEEIRRQVAIMDRHHAPA